MAKVVSQRGLKVRPCLQSICFDYSYQRLYFLTGLFLLQNYIQELRACKTKDAEYERVQKELGKIRKKYTSSKGLSGVFTFTYYFFLDALYFKPCPFYVAYDQQKYLWKLMYTKMMGYDVDFGHKQAMDMMAAPTFAEKQVGYIVCAMFLCENDALLRLVINSVRSDILSRNEAFQCLALEFTANGMFPCDALFSCTTCTHLHVPFCSRRG